MKPLAGDVSAKGISGYFFPRLYTFPMFQFTDGITANETGYHDGVLTCTFRRQTVVEGNAKIFPLNGNYSILMASGEMDGSNKRYHGDSKRYTGLDVDLTIRGDDTSGATKVHGNLCHTAGKLGRCSPSHIYVTKWNAGSFPCYLYLIKQSLLFGRDDGSV